MPLAGLPRLGWQSRVPAHFEPGSRHACITDHGQHSFHRALHLGISIKEGWFLTGPCGLPKALGKGHPVGQAIWGEAQRRRSGLAFGAKRHWKKLGEAPGHLCLA